MRSVFDSKHRATLMSPNTEIKQRVKDVGDKGGNKDVLVCVYLCIRSKECIIIRCGVEKKTFNRIYGKTLRSRNNRSSHHPTDFNANLQFSQTWQRM